MSENERNVVIGEVATTFGIKGEVKIWPYTDFPEHFEGLKEVCVSLPESGSRTLKIDKVRLHKNAVVVKFAGIDDITTAEKLRGARVLIQESELMPLPEGEYYIHDILGMDVITIEGENLGKVKEILKSPANDVYVTDRAMIPAVKEFVKKIDLEKKTITVDSVEGLIQE